MNKDLIKQANEILLKNGENILIDESMSFKSEEVQHPMPLTHSSPKTVESFILENKEYAMRITIADEYGILGIVIDDGNNYRSYVTEANYL